MNTTHHISVLIVEDVPIFLRRFTDAVLGDPDLRLTGAVDNGTSALALLDLCLPDVMMIDPNLSDRRGIDVIRHAVKNHPKTHVLVATTVVDEGQVLACVEAGATGYLLKPATAARILNSIHELHDSGASIGPGAACQVLSCVRQVPLAAVALPAVSAVANAKAHDHTHHTHHTHHIDAADPALLSQRESDVLRLVAKGIGFAEVGAQLFISPHTVVTHVKKIYRKLAVHSRGEAVYEAGQLGLL